jgi:membrane protease YdiL (CAAX protease family)
VTRQRERRLGAGQAVALLFVAGIIGAEAIAVAIGAVAGAACQAVLLLAILNTYAFTAGRPESRLLPFLALAPLLRILSLTMPNRHIAEVWWYPLIGAPLLLAAFLTVRAVPVAWPGLGIRRKGLAVQAAVVLAGAGLSAAAYEILTPSALVSPVTVPTVLGASVLLLFFSAFPEELIFRGFLQGAAREVFGGAGLVITSALYAGLYIGSMSVAYVAFMGAVGLALAIVVDRTGVLWGAIGAHALLNIGLLLVWPAVHA